MKHITANLSLVSSIGLFLDTEAFQPTQVLPVLNTHRATAEKHLSKVNIDVDYYNPSRGIDIEHAHDCAEHFGKCSIQELENIRSALHTERLQHQLTNYQSSDLVEEIDHRLLEEDLDFQLALLKDEMHTLPQWSSPHFINNGKPSFSPPPMMMDSSGNAALPHVHHQQEEQQHKNVMDMKSMIRRGEEMFLMPNGFADLVAFAVAFFIISLSSFIFMQQ